VSLLCGGEVSNVSALCVDLVLLRRVLTYTLGA